MHRALPPLTALRAFEAAARHLSLTKAAAELAVTPAALSHQIKGLEAFLGVKLFSRRSRSIALTEAGHLLYPGLHAGFTQIRQAVGGLERLGNDRVLVISTPPGFTAKWLTPRLYRFLEAHPDIDARISSSMGLANFITDGVDVAIRNMRTDLPPNPDLIADTLFDLILLPVCSPKVCRAAGGLRSPADLKGVPLIHDESLTGRALLPGWAEWLDVAGVKGVDVRRGLRFNSADHALEAAVEGAGVVLAHKILALDDLRTGRLVAPFDLELSSPRAFYFVCPRGTETRPVVSAFRAWLIAEAAALDLAAPLGRSGRRPKAAR